MSQFLSQTLSQQMRMEQRLTPQLIQSMSILQKSVADLETYINEALETNAALDVSEPAATSSDTGDEERAASPSVEGAPDNGRKPPRGEEDVGFARLDRYTRTYDLDGGDRPPHMARRASDGERDAKMGALANTEGRAASLHEFLLDQWALQELDPELRRAGSVIIDQLDPDGYLRVPLDGVADSVRPPLSVGHVRRALSEVQRLEPAGIAARDIVECLLLQLDRQPGDNTIERTLIKNHLDDLAHNRLPQIAKATNFTIGEIQEAIRAMRANLFAHPGYLVGDRSVPPIRPDVIVDYADTGGGFTVRLARGNIPELRIRDEVAALARSKDNGKDTREFARRHVEAASAIIDALAFRQNRLLEVTRAIVERQREFFDLGPEGLKVFRMSDLAAELGCDPSTVSRTVADKYMQTPRGIFPLRYFFTGGTETDEGVSVGWDRVKTRVKEIVDAEDRSNPLSDDQIGALLRADGIEISRRTIAKYRQQLGIVSARHRRVY
ncbi:MAG: RNA polymerase factor sigma-54 [Planctomycetes bacterium]|nr:RNA polymerase factor sigma-54 [Planctomycetota bacterium]